MEKEVTSVRIGKTIHRAAKFAALEHHLTLREFLELALQERLYPRKLVDNTSPVYEGEGSDDE